ncbi:MAG: type II toxin-antitoxin system RelE/ParE family toxin [Planctomycetota bacterium]
MNESIRVDIHPSALVEFNEADDWYEQKDQQTAARFRETIYKTLERIGRVPLEFPVLEEPIRRCVVRGFPYVILFQQAGSRPLVVAIAHTRQKPGYWKKRIND